MTKHSQPPKIEDAINALGFDPAEIVPIDPDLVARIQVLMVGDDTPLDLDSPLSPDDD